jgi:mRNA interferase MazF
MAFRRGDIHWIAFPDRDPAGSEIEKKRPGVIMSRTKANEFRRTVVVVPLTRGSRELPPIVIAIPSVGADSKAVCDQICAVDKMRVGARIGSLTDTELDRLAQSLRKVLNL